MEIEIARFSDHSDLDAACNDCLELFRHGVEITTQPKPMSEAMQFRLVILIARGELVSKEPESTVFPGYQEIRLGSIDERPMIWRKILNYLSVWIDLERPVLEIGAGTGDIIRQISAENRVAIDVDPDAPSLRLHGVRGVVANVRDRTEFRDSYFGTIFASNVLEHLVLEDVITCLNECRRVLTEGGHLIIVQPNYRLNPKRYFDDFTHRSIFSDISMNELLVGSGFHVVRVESRFLPLTVKSRLRKGYKLIPLYLKFPFRPFAGQMLLIAQKKNS